MQWKRNGGYVVKLHSDVRLSAVDWCRFYMRVESWEYKKYTASYQDTYWFEFERDAKAFKTYDRHKAWWDF